eukprot:s851_g4.t1
MLPVVDSGISQRDGFLSKGHCGQHPRRSLIVTFEGCQYFEKFPSITKRLIQRCLEKHAERIIRNKRLRTGVWGSGKLEGDDEEAFDIEFLYEGGFELCNRKSAPSTANNALQHAAFRLMSLARGVSNVSSAKEAIPDQARVWGICAQYLRVWLLKLSFD